MTEDEKHVGMTIKVPAVVRRSVRHRATIEGTTDRVIVLKALRTIGISVPDEALQDRRTVRKDKP